MPSLRPVRSFFQREYQITLSVASLIAFLACFGGLAATLAVVWRHFELPPTRHIAQAWSGMHALRRHLELELAPGPHPNLWFPARGTQVGVTHHDPALAQEGYTLYSNHSTEAFLLDMQGRVVHRWSLPFREVWPHPEHLAENTVVGEDRIYWRRIWLYPNGDLLAVYNAVSDTPYGYGLAKIDRNSQLIWKASAHYHHDVKVMDDGRIYTIDQRIRNAPIEGLEHIDMPVLEDFITELDAEGTVRREIPVTRALATSPYWRLLQNRPVGDITHINSVDILTDELRESFPIFPPGALLLSSATMNAIMVLDPESERIVWVLDTLTVAQHDAEFLDNGHILVFDNQGYQEGGMVSRILEFDPQTQAIVWQYLGTKRDPFYSKIRGSQQVLPNGNILITEATGGRLFEITPSGRIVWEFWNPSRGGGAGEMMGVINSGTRFASRDLPFLSTAKVDVR